MYTNIIRVSGVGIPLFSQGNSTNGSKTEILRIVIESNIDNATLTFGLVNRATGVFTPYVDGAQTADFPLSCGIGANIGVTVVGIVANPVVIVVI